MLFQIKCNNWYWYLKYNQTTYITILLKFTEIFYLDRLYFRSTLSKKNLRHDGGNTKYSFRAGISEKYFIAFPINKQNNRFFKSSWKGWFQKQYFLKDVPKLFNIVILQPSDTHTYVNLSRDYSMLMFKVS